MRYAIYLIVIVSYHSICGQDCIVSYYQQTKLEHVKIQSENFPSTVDLKKFFSRVQNSKTLYALMIEDSKSKFYYRKSIDENGKDLKTIVFRKPYFKDFSTGNLIIESSTNSNQAVVTNLDSLNQWKITNKDTVISDINCTMAINERDGAIAYFTKSISVSNGPWHYGGLPGLIIMLDQPNSFIKFEDINCLGTNEEPIRIPRNYNKVISFEKYLNNSKARP